MSHTVLEKNVPTTLQAWLIAVRLRTLPIPSISVIVGTALAWSMHGRFSLPLFLSPLLVGWFVTLGTNLINDALDFKKGGDPLNRFGHTKVIRAGLLSQRAVLIGGLACFALAILFGIPMMLKAGWVMALIIVLSTVCGYCYTGGPYPWSYNGVSEIFIFVFYGFVSVGASFYVQTEMLTFPVLLAGTQIGMLSILPLATNNLRDIYEDAEISKKTLAVRFGTTFARWEINAFILLPFALGFFWLAYGNPYSTFLPFLVLPVALLFLSFIWNNDPSPSFNRFFALCVLTILLFGILLSAGLILAPMN